VAADRDPVMQVRALSHAYGTVPALANIDFAVQRRETVCIVGPSGAGKTTLLRCLAGLLQPTEGEVVFEGTPVTGPPARLAVVFQDYGRSLMPWLTVLGNVVLPLRSAGLSRDRREERAQEALGAVGLPADLRKYPWQLSGGMQQRVAIARALAYQPAVVVMDEPFASVDAQTRGDLEDLVLELRRLRALTVVLVTHDIDEAVYMADRIVVLSGSPASVARIIPVDLGPTRSPIATKALPRFAELRGEVYGMIKRGQPGG
jgi:NitT/TauT family transport system ATP-binding protein